MVCHQELLYCFLLCTYKHIFCLGRISFILRINTSNFKKSYMLPLVLKTLLIANKNGLVLEPSTHICHFRSPVPNRLLQAPSWWKDKDRSLLSLRIVKVFNLVKYLFNISWDDHVLMSCVTLIDFHLLKYPCIPGKKITHHLIYSS